MYRRWVEIERAPACFRLTIRAFTVTRRERGPGARTLTFMATEPRWKAADFRAPDGERLAVTLRRLTRRAKSSPTRVRERPPPLALGRPSLGRI